MIRFALLMALSITALSEAHRCTAEEASDTAEASPVDDRVTPDPPVEEPIPRDNSEFYGITIKAAVTRRFEMYSPHSREALVSLKAMGFTQVILDWPNLHTDATEVGLDVVLANWWTDKSKPKDIDAGVNLATQVASGRLVGFSVMDEPERNSPETPFGFYIDLYDQLRPRLDGEGLADVPIEISHWGPLAQWDQRYYDYFSYLYEAADVMRIMPYPDLREGPLDEVTLMMLRSREVMSIAEVDLPLVVILQTWVLPPKNTLPEIAELRVMGYQALLGGAEVLSFFDHNPKVWAETPGFTEGFSSLMQELTTLSDRLSGATIESTLQENGILIAHVTEPSGRRSTIRVNTNRSETDDLPALAIGESSSSEEFAAAPVDVVGGTLPSCPVLSRPTSVCPTSTGEPTSLPFDDCRRPVDACKPVFSTRRDCRQYLRHQTARCR